MGKSQYAASGINFIFFVSNLIFAIVAIVLIAVGCVLVVDYNHYLDFLQRGGDWSLIGSIGYLIIGIGVFVTLVYVLGTVGACKKNKCMLYSFAAILGLIIVIEMAIAITLFVYSGTLPTVLGSIMRNNIKEYKSTSDDTIKFEWDEIQTNFECCGVKNYTDWEDIFPNGTQLAPFACCKSTTSCYRADQVTKDKIYSHGCFTKFERALETKLGVVGQTTITIVSFQLISIIMAVYFGRNNELNYKNSEN